MIYNTAVKMLDRARIIHLDETIAAPNWDVIAATCDAVMVTMGGMDRLSGSSRITYQDSLFHVHIQSAYERHIPVIALWKGHADYYLRNDRTYKSVNESTPETDEILKLIINAWKIGAWDFATIKSSDAFRRIHAFFFSDLETDAWNGPVDALWHQASFMSTLRNMQSMIAHFRLPEIPLGVYILPSIVQKAISGDGSRPIDIQLYNNRDWIYMYYAQWVPVSGSAPLAALADVFTAKQPLDTFSWLYIPPGMEQRILFHEYAGQFYTSTALLTSSMTAAKVRAVLFQDTKARLLSLLNFNAQPVDCPPGTHKDANGNCIPDVIPADCPPGQHKDASGNCVPDVLPGQHTLDEVFALQQENNALLKALSKHFTQLP